MSDTRTDLLGVSRQHDLEASGEISLRSALWDSFFSLSWQSLKYPGFTAYGRQYVLPQSISLLLGTEQRLFCFSSMQPCPNPVPVSGTPAGDSTSLFLL